MNKNVINYSWLRQKTQRRNGKIHHLCSMPDNRSSGMSQFILARSSVIMPQQEIILKGHTTAMVYKLMHAHYFN